MKITTKASILFALMAMLTKVDAKSAPMDPELAQNLVKVCQALKSNNKLQLRAAIKTSRVKAKVISEELVCNGMRAAAFALSHKATVTASYITNNGKRTELLANK